MSLVENCPQTTLQAKQCDRRVGEDDSDNFSTTSFPVDTPSVPASMTSDQVESIGKWRELDSGYAPHGTTIHANYVHFSNVNENGKSGGSLHKTEHGHPVMGEHEKSGSSGISTKSKCRSKSMHMVVKNSGEFSRLFSKFEKEKKDLERVCRKLESQLHDEKFNNLKVNIERQKLEMEQQIRDLQQKMRDIEVKHHNELEQERNALMETKNSKDQEIAELQQKIAELQQKYEELQHEVVKKLEECMQKREKVENALRSSQLKCRNERKINDDTLKRNDELEDQVQQQQDMVKKLQDEVKRLQDEQALTVAERNQIRQQFLNSRKSNDRLQRAVTVLRQCLEGRDEEFRQFIIRLCCPPPDQEVHDNPEPPAELVDINVLWAVELRSSTTNDVPPD